MTECSCPICPLVKADVQVCDVVYEELPNKEFGLYCSVEMRQFNQQFEQLVYCAKKSETPIGSNWTHKDDDHTCCVERLADKIYKICFHAHKSGEVSKSDPEAMD
jgi:hypothetical protein